MISCVVFVFWVNLMSVLGMLFLMIWWYVLLRDFMSVCCVVRVFGVLLCRLFCVEMCMVSSLFLVEWVVIWVLWWISVLFFGFLVSVMMMCFLVCYVFLMFCLVW